MILINIWDYKECSQLKIIDVDGDVFEGKLLNITDSGERSDLEPQEDGITLLINGQHVEFMQSEIAQIVAAS